MEDSCRSDLEGRELAEVDTWGLEQEEESLLQDEDSCNQMEGSCWKLLEMNCHGLEGMAGMEGHGEGKLVLMGHLDMVTGVLRAEEDKE